MPTAAQTRPSRDFAQQRHDVRRFVDDELIPREPILDRNDDSSAAAMAELKSLAKERGVWALGHPAAIGGGGLPFMDYVMINEIVGRSYWGTEALGTLSFQDCLMLLEFGTEAQRATWIPLLFEGVTGPTIGMTEPEVAGSDPTLVQTTAVLDGDEWVIDGHKWFTSGANHAMYTTVFAKTDPDAPKHQQFSLILVPTDTPGYNIERVVRTMGHYGGNHCEVRYHYVRVPAENLLGPRGGGFSVAQARLGPGRITHSMRWLGQAQRAFELMCDRATSRFAHGSLLSEKGEIQRYIAESVADLGKPSRFANMLRVFKPQSPMSVGSWVLSGFGASSAASSLADVLEAETSLTGLASFLRAGGRTGCILFGMPFHNYTGVLIGASVIPAWNNRIRSLPREFGMSGLQSAVSLLELCGEDQNQALNALGLVSAAFESWEGIDLLRTKTPELRVTKTGLSGFLIQLAGVLSGPVPIALRLASMFLKNSRTLRRCAALSGIAGSLLMRYGWVNAGSASSRDWKIPLNIEEHGAKPESVKEHRPAAEESRLSS